MPRLVVPNSESSLSAINFNNDGILKIIRSLNINKAHDSISKTCDKAIIKPLSIIYKNSIDTGIFPDLWKKSNIVPVHKKANKLLLQNYRAVSLLPILGKILFTSTFEYLQENNVLCENQSGFRPYDSCELQLLSIFHEIDASSDCNFFFSWDSLHERLDSHYKEWSYKKKTHKKIKAHKKSL